MTGYIPTLEQIDELHRKIAPSKAAYELVHTHCVIVATIGCQIVRRQNALFTRRCTLPKDAEVPPTAGVTGGHVPPRLLDERPNARHLQRHRHPAGAVTLEDGVDTAVDDRR